MISRATRRQLALTGTALALMSAVFGTLTYGALTGNLTPFGLAAVVVAVTEVVFAFVAPGHWTG
ncbi:hypothetical protein GCM10023321_80380 [Pseudonocardia eucalypti]|uniref:Uncharacterized protein n=1 Tax=Pseudonocardia eucalypti TaxID=648755 RepID=A0ABP9RDF2_9PSEU|nr:hypothetical protein [Pseudonocardia eucalypti]